VKSRLASFDWAYAPGTAISPLPLRFIELDSSTDAVPVVVRIDRQDRRVLLVVTIGHSNYLRCSDTHRRFGVGLGWAGLDWGDR
jgi:hypothetical protein